MLKVLYIGSLRLGGNGLDRVAIFEAAGFEVLRADRFPFLQYGTRLERSFAARFHSGSGPARFNQMLSALSSGGGFDIVFVDKGVWVYPEVLAQLKAASTSKIAIHFTPDAQFLENRSRHFFRCLPIYDLVITTKVFEMEAYKRSGAREVKFILQGYGKRVRPYNHAFVPKVLQSEVCFIGHFQRNYASILRTVASRVPLKIWGPGWPAFARSHPWARHVVKGEGFYGSDYAKALSGAKIALGLLSKRIPETSTTRSFEIPACGTMLLAEGTDEHKELFTEGREAIFFDDPDECAELAIQYLRDDTSREYIASSGLSRCLSDGYSAADQFATVIEWIKRRTNTP